MVTLSRVHLPPRGQAPINQQRTPWLPGLKHMDGTIGAAGSELRKGSSVPAPQLLQTTPVHRGTHGPANPQDKRTPPLVDVDSPRKCRCGWNTPKQPENSTLQAPVLSTARPAAAQGRHSSPLIRVSWAPVGQPDEESTATTSSHIKIEPFIQDPDQGLLILSKQMGY